MIQKLSRRRGAVSVFLLIIFMITYVFMGLLVDAARYRMGQTYVESALDTASDSVLSHYNRLLFDLYGLFALDTGEKEEEEVTKKVQEYYNTYLEETLGLVDADIEEYRTALNSIFDTMTDQESSADISTKQMYNFSMDQLDCGTVISLADHENVENQIVEYMKFRAPVQLVDEVFGNFLNKINEIVALKGQVEVAMKKLEIMDKEEYKSLPQEAYELQTDINTYLRRLYWYTIEPPSLSSFSVQEDPYVCNPYRLKELLTEFDKGILKNEADYRDECADIERRAEEDKEALREDYAEIMKLPGADLQALSAMLKENLENVDAIKDEELENAKNTLMDDYEKTKEDLSKKFLSIENSAGELIEEAEQLYVRLGGDEEEEGIIGKYTKYIEELESAKNEVDAMDASDDNKENMKDMYDMDIDQLKATAGELLRNLDPLFNTKECLKKIEVIGFDKINDEASSICSKRHPIITGASKGTLPKLLTEKIQSDPYINAQDSKELYLQGEYPQFSRARNAEDALQNQQKVLCILYSYAAHFQGKNETEEKDAEEGKKVSDKEPNTPDPNEMEEEEKPGLPPLDHSDLLESKDYEEYFTVPNEKTVSDRGEDVETGGSIEGKADAAGLLKLLEVAKQLIEKLGEILSGLPEKGRDNLYINAYITSTFPNYYDYRKYGEYLNEEAYEEHKDELKKLSSSFQKEYWDYIATYASVEYIITGSGAGRGEVFGDISDGAGVESIAKIKTKLFGTRMIFNCLSMFIDSSKRTEATALSAWAGPFSPLVALVLMVAWAAAESVLDVCVLTGTGGEALLDVLDKDRTGEVPLIKTGDWYFSLSAIIDQAENGLVNTLVDKTVDGLTEKLQNGVQEAGEGLKNQMNSLIYETYNKTYQGAENWAQDIKTAGGSIIEDWTDQIKDSINTGEEQIQNNTGTEISDGDVSLNEMLDEKLENGIQMLNDGLKGDFEHLIDNGKDKVQNYTENAKEWAVSKVSQATDQMVERVNNQINKIGESAVEGTKELISEHLSKVVPKNSRTQLKKKKITIKLSYKDYMNIYLFLMNGDMKARRIQSIIQANMHAGGQDDFWMEGSPVTVWADLECSMKYMFLSDPIVPKDMRRDGRLRLKVISGQGY